MHILGIKLYLNQILELVRLTRLNWISLWDFFSTKLLVIGSQIDRGPDGSEWDIYRMPSLSVLYPLFKNELLSNMRIKPLHELCNLHLCLFFSFTTRLF